MVIFKKCDQENCESDADSSCSCSLLLCNRHLLEHLQAKGFGHTSSHIALPLNHKELYLFNAFRFTESDLKKEMSKRNKKVSKLLDKLREIEKEYSLRFERIILLQSRKERLLSEIKQKKKLPLISDCDLAMSLANLKKQNKISPSSIQEIFSLKYKCAKEVEEKDDIHDLALHLELTGHSRGIETVSVSPCSRYIASGSRDKSIKIWEMKTGTLLATMEGHKKTVRSLNFSTSNSLLLSSSNDMTVKIWDLEQSKCFSTYTRHTDYVLSAVFSRDSQLVASASYKVIHLWKTADGNRLLCLKGHSDWVNKVLFISDDEVLVSASSDRSIKIWDARNGNNLMSLRGHSDAVWTFAVHKNLIASGSNDNSVKIWNAKTGECLTTLCGHSQAVYSVGFTNSGNTVISGSKDETINIWNHSELIKAIHNVPITDAIQVAGQEIVSGHRDSTVKVWRFL